MIKRCAFFASLLLLTMTTPSMAATDAEKAELEAKKAAADLVLNDDSFFKKWSQKGVIKSPEMAETVKKEAESIRNRLDDALDDRRAWCNTRFFVNACLDESRKLSFTRDRELRQVIVAAEDVLRAERTRRISEKLDERRADKAEPVKVSKPRLKAPVEPMNFGRHEGGATPAASDHVGQTAEDVRENNHRANLAREQEEANEALYEKKQREAARRLAEAESKAAERRRSREEHRERFQKKMEERIEAQERYERRQQEKDSGLKKYF